MTERRQVLSGALALVAVPFVLPSLASRAHAAPAALPQPALFLYDQSFTAARHLAAQLAASGQDVTGFEGDLLPLWRTRLQALWQAGPAVVGGLTNANALFLLETLGADHGLKLAHRVELTAVAEAEPLFHWLLVPRSKA
jgi:hypothetical protein